MSSLAIVCLQYCDWETQLQEALHLLGHVEHTVGLQAAAPSYVRGLLCV